MAHLSRLRTLYLDHNEIEGTLVPACCEASPLACVSLAHNRIHSVAAGTKPLHGSSSSLTELNLSHNCLQQVPAAWLRQCSTGLRHLSLAFNVDLLAAGTQAADELTEVLRALTALRSLDLSGTALTDAATAGLGALQEVRRSRTDRPTALGSQAAVWLCSWKN